MYITKTTQLFAGETKLHDRRLSMCVMPNASFLGGSGDAWVVQDACYEFRLKKAMRSFRGICTTIRPEDKAMHFLLIGGDMWGKYAQGQSLFARCEDLEHIYPTRRHKMEHFDTDTIERLKTQAEVCMGELALKELEIAISDEHSRYMQELVGKQEYKQIKNLIKSFVRLSQHAHRGVIDCDKAPTPTLLGYQNSVRWQLKQLKETNND